MVVAVAGGGEGLLRIHLLFEFFFFVWGRPKLDRRGGGTKFLNEQYLGFLCQN